MEKLTQYRNLIEEVLHEHYRLAASAVREGEIENQLIIDRERDHYQILDVGWRNDKESVFGCPIHISIKSGKIWIERDFTEIGVANELIERGVPKEDIVLAFHAPYKRPYTGFAVA